MEETQRQRKMSSLLIKELSSIFIREWQGDITDNMLTVSQVRVTRDLSLAKVYIRFLKPDPVEKWMELIQNQTPRIRFILASQLKNQMRKVPELRFFLDDTGDYVDKIDTLLEQVKNKK